MTTLVAVEDVAAPARRDQARRWRFVLALALLAATFGALGLVAGSEGLSWAALHDDIASGQAGLVIGEIRAPRTLGALLVGALLGLAGALAQALFRNPLADPYLLGSGSGATLAVVLVLAAGAMVGAPMALATLPALARLGVVAAAFLGALAGVLLTLLLARGAQQTMRLLLAGVVVGVVLGAGADLMTTWSPAALRGKTAFMLGSTGLLGWGSVVVLGAGLVVALPLAARLARGLDALALGEESAASLGLPLARLRFALVLLLALATGVAVSQAGLVAFVGLVAPHLVRRFAPAPQRFTIAASAAAGGVLLLGADVLARSITAPMELPVGVLTALLGGSYLLWLLHRREGLH